MSYTTHYRIAGLPIAITLPKNQPIEQLLASAEGFRLTEATEPPILHIRALGICPQLAPNKATLLSEDTNDMGRVRLSRDGEAFLVELQYLNSQYRHHMLFSEGFGMADLAPAWEDPTLKEAFSSLVRIAYSLAILRHGAISIHASAIHRQGESILFLGKSGTGKSTHANLWLEHDPTAQLLNDDNPTLRREGEQIKAYGTPWSGKRPCYKNEGYPVRGIVRLSQAPQNRFRRLADTEAFIALLPSCSMIRQEEDGADRAYTLLGDIIQHVIVGSLTCRPDQEAYQCCAAGLGL